MKYLAFILLVVLFSCSKQEYVEVRYDITSTSNGLTMFSFDGVNYDTLNSEYTKTAIYPISDNYTYDFGITVNNRSIGEVSIKGYINGELKLNETMIQDKCGSMHKHFEIIY